MSSGAYTDSVEHCPRCNVPRATLPSGGWCSVCGYNPDYEKQIIDLTERAERAEEAHTGVVANVLAKTKKIYHVGIAETDDWACLYINHKAVLQGHQIRVFDLAEHLKDIISIDFASVGYEVFDQKNWSKFPKTWDEVKSVCD